MKNILKKLLLKCVEDLDSGNSNITEEEGMELVDYIKELSNKEILMSKYQAYTYLNISRASFDNKVKEGIIPQGIKKPGFKELFWIKRDLDKVIKSK